MIMLHRVARMRLHTDTECWRMPRNALQCHAMPCNATLEQVLVAESDQLEHPVADVMAELTLDSIFLWHLTWLIQDNSQAVRLDRCTSMNYSCLYLFARITSHDEAAPCSRNFSFEGQASCQRQHVLDIWSLRLEALQKQNSVLACLVCERGQNLWRWVDMGQPRRLLKKSEKLSILKQSQTQRLFPGPHVL